MALSDFNMTENEAEYLLGSLLHCYILEILAYGIYTVMYFVALYLTLTRGAEKARTRPAILLTMMWLLGTVRAIIKWILVDNTFVHHAESRESEIRSVVSIQGIFSLDVIGFIATFLSVLLADNIMIWRCWVLYERRWLAIIIPVLSFILGTMAYIIQAVLHFSFKGVEISAGIAAWQVVFLATTVFTNIFCTFAIIYRFISLSGFYKSFKTYHGILEIVIESSVLYTSIYLIQIGLYVHTMYFTDEWDVRYYYAEALANVVTGVAPTLIIACVAAGYTQPDYLKRLPPPLPQVRTVVQSFRESQSFGRLSSTGVDGNRSRYREEFLE